MNLFDRIAEFRRRINIEGKRKTLKRLYWELEHVENRMERLKEHRREIAHEIDLARIAYRAAQLPRMREQ